MRLPPLSTLGRAAASACLVAFGGAQQPVIDVPAHSHLQVQAWDATSGLPQNTVSGLQFDRDGMLWVATFGGLCRFDGVAWRAENASGGGLQDQRITVISQDAAGELLVGTEQGTLFSRRNGRFHRLAQVPGNNMRYAGAGAPGQVWCGTSEGLFAVREDGSVVELADRERRDARALLPFDDGPQLVTRLGVFRIDALGAAPVIAEACTSAVMVDGRAFVGMDSGLLAYDGREYRVLATPDVPEMGTVTALAATANGLLWVGCAGMLCRIDPLGGAPPLVLRIGHRVRSLLVEGDRAVWVGFEGGGLVRLVDSEVELLPLQLADEELREPHSVLAAGEGTWWVGTERGLFRSDGRQFEAVHGLQRTAIGGLVLSSRGELWVGVEGGVSRLRGDQLEHFGQQPPGRVRAIHLDASGRLWSGTEDGVRWLQGGRWAEPPAELVMRGETVKLIVALPGGDLWIASNRSLLRLAPDLRVTLRLQNGVELPHGEVRAVLPTASDRVWLGCYGGGFVAVDGDQLRSVGAPEGLFDPFVCSVLPVDDRWVVGSNRGTFLIEPEALDRVVDGKHPRVVCRPLFGPRGAAAEASGGVFPSIARAGDQVLLCGVRGLLTVDLQRLHRWPPPGSCTIDGVAAGGRRLSLQDQQNVVLGTAVERVITVEVAAPCFDAPELQRHRWRLLPEQPEWTEPTAERQISFGVTTPGLHRFEVQAWSVDGRGGPVTSLSLQVQPRLLERTSTRIGFVVLVLLLGGLAIRFGGRRAARRARLLRRLVDERTLELRELHKVLEQRVADRTAELRAALEQSQLEHQQRLQLQHELQQFQRMESLGALAGGVAHDFNNLLTVVLGNASLLEAELPPGGPQIELAARMREAAEQGRRMTRHLLTVASRQTVQTEVVDLVEQVRGQLPLLTQLVGSGVRLELELPAAACTVRAAPTQLEQVLSNLCINARDAMPDGGLLRISVRRVAAGVEMRVADTGVGMSEEVLQRAFEPFFSTKRTGRGTGLGLATVYGITKQLGGRVHIESALGAGTTFVLVLPVVEPLVDIPRVDGRASGDARVPQQDARRDDVRS